LVPGDKGLSSTSAEESVEASHIGNEDSVESFSDISGSLALDEFNSSVTSEHDSTVETTNTPPKTLKDVLVVAN